jgi:hypothetical protein
MVRRVDNHTWTDKVGDNERWILKEDGRGVRVIDQGKAGRQAVPAGQVSAPPGGQGQALSRSAAR